MLSLLFRLHINQILYYEGINFYIIRNCVYLAIIILYYILKLFTNLFVVNLYFIPLNYCLYFMVMLKYFYIELYYSVFYYPGIVGMANREQIDIVVGTCFTYNY